jgi:flagellar biosynthesis chaperone FliJ
MSAFTYRLQLLLDQKEELKKVAARELLREELELEKQHEKMRHLQQSLQELIEKRKQMRRELFRKPEGNAILNAMKVQERTCYIDAVGAQIEDLQSDIVSQRTVIEECGDRAQRAKNHVKEANREVEVLQKHRAKQEERFQRDLNEKEERTLDEIGNVLYVTRRRSI